MYRAHSTILILLSVMAIITCFLQKPTKAYAQAGDCYVNHRKVNIRSGPGKDYTLVRAIDENVSLYCLSEKSGWSQIFAVDGIQGWVRSDLISKSVVRIHQKDSKLQVVRGYRLSLNAEVDLRDTELALGRYFGRWEGEQLVLSWPNRKDLRNSLSKGVIGYPDYVRAIRGGGDGEKTLALCSEANNDGSCAIVLSHKNFNELRKLLSSGVRVELYQSEEEMLALNSPDELSRRIYEGAVGQLRFPAAGLAPDSVPPSLHYPGGDIQPDFATSTDIVIRAVRAAGVDLQAAVHEDYLQHPKRYAGFTNGGPGVHRDPSVLYTYMEHHAVSLPLSVNDDPFGFEAGDIVFFSATADGEPDHAGIVGETFNSMGYPLVITVWDMGQTAGKLDLLGRKNHEVVGHFRMTHLFDYQ